MRMLLVSTYELGHQPLHVASPAAALRASGHDVRCLDLSVQPWDAAAVEWADAIAFSVPMHTAMRLAVQAAEMIRAHRPDLPICLYGLYAPVSRDATVGRAVDQVFAGEYEPALISWAARLDHGASPADPSAPLIHLGRGRASFARPARDLLPPLEHYARLADRGGERLVGYVEATHGCAHRCRHCPVPTVYDGAFRVVDEAVVGDDIAQLVQMGATHITFGDPDFLNGPAHALRVVRAMHERFPHLTFDCTVKVEHILAHDGIWPEMARAGCRFAVSAIECLNDRILALLAKGHTADQAAGAVKTLRRAGIEPRPSFMPFTPWTTISDVVDVLDFVLAHDLVANVDPVQYSIRLLLPEGSLLLDVAELEPHLGPYDAERLSYQWTPADPRTDALQVEIAALAERFAATGEAIRDAFLAIDGAVRAAAGRPPMDPASLGDCENRPRLTEPWFCCAEPTTGQLQPIGRL
ncbi:MAG TPA: CUAEP/CCAEP-tail radical SAM protein [Egibacteraceae bacterium]|nr:CUAEP/CCAEP-tail radical SAM protein [Egibacteraceae bacterium]